MTIKRAALRWSASWIIAGLLSACGGGGGGGTTPPPDGSSPPPPVGTTPAAPAVLTFSAPTVTASVEAGRSAALSADATVTNPADFATASAVYAYIVDTTGVILPQVQITQTGATSYRAVMQTAPTLPEGKYSGNFAVRVCRDVNCVQQFPGSPMQLPYLITVTAPAASVLGVIPNANLDLTTNVGKPVPAPVPVRVLAAGKTWTATTNAKWLTLAEASGSGDGSFRVGYDLSAMALGLHSSTIVITSSDGQTVTVPVRLALLAVAFSVDRGQVTFNAVNGAPIEPEGVKFNVTEGAATWSAGSSAPWLSVSPAGGPTPGVTSLKVDPSAGSLASGQHTAQVSINAPNVQTTTIPVTLNLTQATLTASTPSVTLGGPYGRDNNQAAISLTLNTQGNFFPWSLSPAPLWLAPSTTGGQVSRSGATINFSQVLGALPTGTSVATLTATARVNGDTVTTPITVTANRDTHKLLFSETGVALASTPGWSRLSRKVTVSDNFGQAPDWSAVSDQAWLTVARNGNELTLTANPAGLPDNAVSYGMVRLLRTDTAISVPETLRVGVWKGSATPTAITKLNKSYVHLKTDPIRPYLYANAEGTSIDVYNVYTAALVGTINGVGSSLGAMAVSQDGATLYVYDTANRSVVVVDLATMTKTTSWPLASAVDHYSKLLTLRPNGVPLLIANDGTTYDTVTGRTVGRTGMVPTAVTADGKRMYTTAAYDIDFSAMAGGTMFSKLVETIYDSDDIAVSADGAYLYTAKGSPYQCRRISPTDFSLIGYLPGGEAYPNNIEVGSDGRVYCGIMGWYSTADVWVHSKDGALLGSFKFAGYARALAPRSLNISGDGLIMVGLTDDPLLVFVPVGP